MKLFIAGCYYDRQIVNVKIKEAQDLGFTITHNWTDQEDMNRSNDALGEYARLDLNGVKSADILIALMDAPDLEYPYRGTWTEIGAAIALGKEVWIVSNLKNTYTRSNVYFYYPGVKHFETWMEAKMELIKLI